MNGGMGGLVDHLPSDRPLVNNGQTGMTLQQFVDCRMMSNTRICQNQVKISNPGSKTKQGQCGKTKTNDFILWKRNVCNSCPVFLAAPLSELSGDQRYQAAKDGGGFLQKNSGIERPYFLCAKSFLGKIFELSGKIGRFIQVLFQALEILLPDFSRY